MDKESIKAAKDWYEKDYKEAGFKAQRLYPNEELLRFFGRNLFSIPKEQRKDTKVLEVGCGSCANLWMVAHEGFDSYGLDLSEESLKLGQMRLDQWNVTARLFCASMTEIPFEDNSLDVLIDVFSAYCLAPADYIVFIKEVHRVLKKGGLFFSYTPSVESEAFKNHAPARLIDKNTLNGIYRKDSPFTGNYYPFRFDDVKELEQIHKAQGFGYRYRETITRTYNNLSETFQHISLELVKL